MTTITVKTQFTGLHCWPKAPAEVMYLRHPHRHVFHVEFEIQVYHDDREVEFFILQKQIKDFVDQVDWPIEASCEFMAKEIIDFVSKHYCLAKHRYLRCSVFEDGECGATVSTTI